MAVGVLDGLKCELLLGVYQVGWIMKEDWGESWLSSLSSHHASHLTQPRPGDGSHALPCPATTTTQLELRCPTGPNSLTAPQCPSNFRRLHP